MVLSCFWVSFLTFLSTSGFRTATSVSHFSFRRSISAVVAFLWNSASWLSMFRAYWSPLVSACMVLRQLTTAVPVWAAVSWSISMVTVVFVVFSFSVGVVPMLKYSAKKLSSSLSVMRALNSRFMGSVNSPSFFVCFSSASKNCWWSTEFFFNSSMKAPVFVGSLKLNL